MIGQRLEPYSGVVVGLPPKFCDGRGSIPTGVNCEASRVLRKLKGIFVFLHVTVSVVDSVRICTYQYIYECICMYLHVLFSFAKLSKYEMYIYARIKRICTYYVNIGIYMLVYVYTRQSSSVRNASAP